MHRVEKKHYVRMYGFGIVVVFAAAAAVLSGSCFLDTRTSLCGESGLRCPPGWSCTADQLACILGGCGNGVPDEDEVCDDGNVSDGDGCSADCTSNETCGNGIMDMIKGELCDDGNTIARDGCSPECLPESKVCGNLIVEIEIGEVCDDGNMESFDGCRNDCASNEACGNSIMDLHLGEECEFPDSPFPRSFLDTAACDNDCTNPMCGDGHHNPEFLVTGAGPDHNEQCDTGVMGTRMDSPACDSDCTFVNCGDDHANTEAGEECDDGAIDTGDGKVNSNTAKDACRTDCRRAFCGDGVTDTRETCDDDNNDNNDLCPSGLNGTCEPAECGDDHVRTVTDSGHPTAEQCDDGETDIDGDGKVNSNTMPDACREDCRNHFCGDGVKDSGEVCDKGGSGNPEVGCGPSETCNSNCTVCG